MHKNMVNLWFAAPDISSPYRKPEPSCYSASHLSCFLSLYILCFPRHHQVSNPFRLPRSYHAAACAVRSHVGSAVASGDGEDDRISALPDDALHHILSFLPSDDAVRTSVLAGRWRHLWRSTRTLCLTPGSWTAPVLIRFMNRMLLLRGVAPVDACEIICEYLNEDWDERNGEVSTPYKYKLDEELNRAACLWIRHALAICHARELRVWLRNRRRVCLDHAHFASLNLTSVEFTDAAFVDSSVDFSRCPALKELTIYDWVQDSCRQDMFSVIGLSEHH